MNRTALAASAAALALAWWAACRFVDREVAKFYGRTLGGH